jgi:hypothetical protein
MEVTGQLHAPAALPGVMPQRRSEGRSNSKEKPYPRSSTNFAYWGVLKHA